MARWGKDSPITVAGAAPVFKFDQTELGTGFPINPVLRGTFNAKECIEKTRAVSIEAVDEAP